MSRYIVTELEGFSEHDSAEPGKSFQCIDTVENRRVVATFRSEDFEFAVEANIAAHEYAEGLNGERVAA